MAKQLIPANAHALMVDILELCKSAAAYGDEMSAVVDKLKGEMETLKKQATAPKPSVGFTEATALAWAEQAKQAGIVDEEASSEKLASMIQNQPSGFISLLLQVQMPPDSQGQPLEKAANTLSGEKKLVDHDGWLNCLRD